jgi:acyl-CoA synthetase (AMP-forming)/AMP-acid ligase II
MASEKFSVADVIRGHAANSPSKEALVCGATRLTYVQIDERSSRVGAALLQAGLAVGSRVGLLAKNNPEFYEVLFGCSKSGMVLVPLNWRLASAELAVIVTDAELELLLVDVEHESAAREALGDDAGVRIVTFGPMYEEWLSSAPGVDPRTPIGRDDVAVQFYSSGTTGRPKGIMLTHDNFSYSMKMARQGFRMTSESVNMVVAPLFHVGGAGYGLMAFLAGGRTVIMQDLDPLIVFRAIEKEGITHTFAVPAVIKMLVNSPDVERHDISSLQLISYGGEPMSETLLKTSLVVLGCDFLGVYGMTETAGTVTVLEAADHGEDGARAGLLRSIGQPLPWLELKVADLTTGEETSPGVVGEIWVRSGQNMKGYWKQTDATASTLVSDGWLRTGDGASRDENGYIFLRDRVKDMIISGGENVYPAEVENVLSQHPAVADVAVIGVPHPRWGETVKAIVVLHPDQDSDDNGLKQFAKGRLASYKCPTSVSFVDELPRNGAGKVLKNVLRERYRVAEEVS